MGWIFLLFLIFVSSISISDGIATNMPDPDFCCLGNCDRSALTKLDIDGALYTLRGNIYISSCSAQVYDYVMMILMRESLGIDADISEIVSYGDVPNLLQMSGCSYIDNAAGEIDGTTSCATIKSVPSRMFAMEVWKTSAVGWDNQLYTDGTYNLRQKINELGLMGYFGSLPLVINKRVADEAYADNVILDHYRTWSNPIALQYFDMPADLLAKPTKACNEKANVDFFTELYDNGWLCFPEHYQNADGEWSEAGWMISAPCLNYISNTSDTPLTSDEIALLLTGYVENDYLDRIGDASKYPDITKLKCIPIATWDTYVLIFPERVNDGIMMYGLYSIGLDNPIVPYFPMNSTYSVMFWWYFPDSTPQSVGYDYISVQSYPPNTFSPSALVKYAWDRLEDLSPSAYSLVTKATFTDDDTDFVIDGLAGVYNDGGPQLRDEEVACLWIKNNTDRWSDWTGVVCSAGYIAVDNVCTMCEAGTYSTLGSVECETCPIGTYSQAAAGSCASCAIGSYSDVEKASECSRCPIGSYNSDLGATSCVECPYGLTTNAVGAFGVNECVCASGRQWDPVTKKCIRCQEGLSCMGSDAVPSVLVGYWTPPLGMTVDAYGNLVPLDNYQAASTRRLDSTDLEIDHQGALSSYEVFKCESEELCPGGDMGACSGGRIGLACTECTEGFARVGNGCRQCNSVDRMILIIIIIVLVVLGCGAHWYFNKESKADKATHLHIFEVVVSWFQNLALFWSLGFSLPDGIDNLLDFIVNADLGVDGMRPECLFPRNDSSLLRYLTPLFIPIIIVACFLVIHIISHFLVFFFPILASPTSMAVNPALQQQNSNNNSKLRNIFHNAFSHSPPPACSPTDVHSMNGDTEGILTPPRQQLHGIHDLSNRNSPIRGGVMSDDGNHSVCSMRHSRLTNNVDLFSPPCSPGIRQIADKQHEEGSNEDAPLDERDAYGREFNYRVDNISTQLSPPPNQVFNSFELGDLSPPPLVNDAVTPPIKYVATASYSNSQIKIKSDDTTADGSFNYSQSGAGHILNMGDNSGYVMTSERDLNITVNPLNHNSQTSVPLEDSYRNHAPLSKMAPNMFIRVAWYFDMPMNLFKVFNTLGFIFTLVFVTLASSALAVFYCDPQPSGKNTVKSMPYVICYEEEWKKELLPAGIVFTLVYAVSFWVFLAYINYCAPYRSAVDPYFNVKYKFLFASFRTEVWWWQSASLLRNLIFTAVIAALSSSASQSGVMVVAVTAGMITHAIYMPMKDMLTNVLELFLLGSLGCMLTLGMFSLGVDTVIRSSNDDSSSSSSDSVSVDDFSDTVFTQWLLFIILILDVAFILYCLIHRIILAKSKRIRRSCMELECNLTMSILLASEKLASHVSENRLLPIISSICEFDVDTIARFISLLQTEVFPQLGLLDIASQLEHNNLSSRDVLSNTGSQSSSPYKTPKSTRTTPKRLSRFAHAVLGAANSSKDRSQLTPHNYISSPLSKRTIDSNNQIKSASSSLLDNGDIDIANEYVGDAEFAQGPSFRLRSSAHKPIGNVLQYEGSPELIPADPPVVGGSFYAEHAILEEGDIDFANAGSLNSPSRNDAFYFEKTSKRSVSSSDWCGSEIPSDKISEGVND